MSAKYGEFLRICERLNADGIRPMLAGSVGLEQVSQSNWKAKDINIYIPDLDGKFFDKKNLCDLMEDLGYACPNTEAPIFKNENHIVAFGNLDHFLQVSGINVLEADLVSEAGCSYYLPTILQFLKIYQVSSQDEDRARKNQNNDFVKVSYLQSLAFNEALEESSYGESHQIGDAGGEFK